MDIQEAGGCVGLGPRLLWARARDLGVIHIKTVLEALGIQRKEKGTQATLEDPTPGGVSEARFENK